MPSVCLATALYEKTYNHYIENDKLRVWLNKFNYPFDEIIILFNNISQEGFEECVKYLQTFTDKKITFAFSQSMTDEVISTFKLDPNYHNLPGYWYSIANFAQLVISKSDYVMYICEDISVVHPSDTFVKDSIEALENNPDCIATSMNWSWIGADPKTKLGHDAGEEEEWYTKPKHKNDKFYLTNGFGDHIYFSSREKLLSIDYNTSHPFVNRFPGYSGQSFDKRLNSYQTIHEMYRYVHKKLHYSHIGWNLYLKDLNLEVQPFSIIDK